MKKGSPGQPVVLSASARESLVRFLQSNRERAITEWERAIRVIPAAALLDREELRDHMPMLIDRVLELVDAPAASGLEGLPERHAMERLEEGYNLEQVAWEYAVLRSTLLRLNDEETEENRLHPEALVLLNDAIDQAVVHAVASYHRARIRMLEALDRIAHEGLLPEPGALDNLLHRLLQVIIDTVGNVDTAILYLLEWDRLVVRAAVGLEREVEGKFELAIGEGFAGAVAQSRRPLITHSAETDSRVRNPVLQKSGIKALYGVPLIYGDDIVGVAKMGSRSVSDFSAEDRQVLRSAADRAAAVIAHRREADDRELLMHILGHDLRSPLNTIVLGASSVKTEEVSPQVARTIERILSATSRMERLIGDLTDYTQSRTSGQLALQRDKFDFCEVLDQVAREMHGRAERKLSFDCTGNITGEWDRGRVVRLLVNLVNNALAYGDPAAPVTVAARADDSTVTVRVHNEGEPIPPDLLPHLFEPFKRGKTGQGAGLGLYIVQQIARAHRGRVEVESSAGQGTTFSVHLPRTAQGCDDE